MYLLTGLAHLVLLPKSLPNLSGLARCVLQTVDRFNNLYVSGFATPAGTRFLLLHDGKGDDSIRQFFQDCYELYLRVSMSIRGIPGYLHVRKYRRMYPSGWVTD